MLKREVSKKNRHNNIGKNKLKIRQDTQNTQRHKHKT